MDDTQRMAEVLPVLGKMDLFAGVGDRALEQVAGAMRPIAIPAQTVVCHEGDPADAFYIIQDGTLRVTTPIADEPRELARIGPGEFFGEVSLLGGGARTATVTALEPAMLWALSSDDFWRLLAADHGLATRVEERAQVREQRSFEVTQRDLGTLMGDRAMLTIGRDPANDLVLDSPLVSQVHASIRRDGPGFALVDQDSASGTFLNGQPIRSAALSAGDEIAIGSHSFYFEPSRLVLIPFPRGLRIEASSVSVDVADGVRLLHDIDLSVQPGEFVSILGASGAGKSTLLNTLASITPPTAGRVGYNGHDAATERERLRKLIGFVPQDDIVHLDLSARRTLGYAARLRLPVDTPRAERKRAVDDTLEQLRLTERADIAVRELSGGQRKRCSIGVELLKRPSAFFLDEPTSGQDPATDASIMRTLRGLADSGGTVVITTHNTASLGLCDRVVILAAGGRLAFTGSPHAALEYFDAPDFETIYEQLDDEIDADAWQERFREATKSSPGPLVDLMPGMDKDAQPLPVTPRHQGRYQTARTARGRGAVIRDRGAEVVIPFISQTVVLTTRYLSVLAADGRNLALLLAQAPVLGILMLLSLPTGELGFPPENEVRLVSTAGLVLFVLLLGGTWIGANNAIREIARELPILRRERAVGLSLSAYVLSKVVVLACLTGLQAVVLVAIAAARQDGPRSAVLLGWPMGELMAVVALAGVASMALGLLISAVAGSPERATSVLPMLLIFQFVLSAGVVLPDLAERPVLRELGLVSSAQWGVAAAGSTADLNSLQVFDQRLRDLRTVDVADPAEAVATLTADDGADERWAHSQSAWLRAVAALIALTVLPIVGAMIALRRYDRGG